MARNKHMLWVSTSVGLLVFIGALYVGQAPRVALAASTPETLEITASPVLWDPENPTETKAGQLTYVGGLELTSSHERFGGLSSLLVGNEGDALIAITDQGDWLTADLRWDNGRLSELTNALIAPIKGPEGDALDGKRESDAEGMTVAPNADPRTSPTLVSFERHHRILSFDLTSLGFDTPATKVEDFGAFDGLENNSGLEAITYLPDGSLLAISEETLDPDGYIVGARLTETEALPVRLKHHVPYALTDIAQLPNGDLVTLERRYSTLGGVGLLMRRIPAAMIDGTEPLDGEILLEANNSRSIDNMEGLDIQVRDDGTSLLYLVSDDNFNPLQRTLLLVFALEE